MLPKQKPGPPDKSPVSSQIASRDIDGAPAKAEILKDIQDGYVFVMSSGKGQPIDETHREIAEELAREEIAENTDFGL